MIQQSAKLKVPVLALGIITVTVIGLTAVCHAAVDRQLHAWKLLPEPERLTELYFTDPNHLPTTYLPGQPQTVKFTVHNLEYRTTTYKYRVLEQSKNSNTSQTLNIGTFMLAQNAFRKQFVNITTPDMGPNVKIVVEITNNNESIDYLLAKEGA